MTVNGHVSLFFWHDNTRLIDTFFVVPSLSEEVIIGADALQKFRIKLDVEHDTIYVDPAVGKVVIADVRM
jgi:hypothetical protein